eukprot:9127579-Ditylum_brightwellii.AAC.1
MGEYRVQFMLDNAIFNNMIGKDNADASKGTKHNMEDIVLAEEVDPLSKQFDDIALSIPIDDN